MAHYHLIQWVLFFYIYCFLGWVWESCYVSVRQHKWVNRGFMHGPFLPIYGFGAVMILLATIPVKENLGLVFICGMVGATLLEYITGTFMEALFHVRYWDYSEEPFNLNGHICLLSSLAWGGFSVLMIKVLHQPIEAVVLLLNYSWAEIIALLVSIAIMMDLIESFNEAMDLKKMLIHLSESNVEIQLIRKRLDVVITAVDTDAAKLKEKLLQSKQKLEEKWWEEKAHYELQLKAMSSKALIENGMEKIKEGKNLVLQALSEKANTYLGQIEEYTSEKGRMPVKELGKLKIELEELTEKIISQKEKVLQLKNKAYKHSVGILRRNPNAISKKHKAALEEIKQKVRLKRKS
ncbi:MAG: hypothetical protein E7231_16710 [Cellulosilyticum sp.]|nr:hypothetical protein [Cellulosilyticum sp.]